MARCTQSQTSHFSEGLFLLVVLVRVLQKHRTSRTVMHEDFHFTYLSWLIMKQESLKVRCLCLARKTQNPSLKVLGRKAPSYSEQGQPLYSLYSSLLLME